MNELTAAKSLRSALLVVLSAALVAAGLAPGTSAEAYSQRRATKAPPAKRAPATPPSVYDQGYNKGYNTGYSQGVEDWRQGYPRDYQRSSAYERRESLYDQRHSANEEYRQGFNLGFELGYSDGYYGRANNAAVPANAAVLAKAAALANAQREREQQAARDAQAHDAQARDDRARDAQARDDRARDDRARQDSMRDNTPRDDSAREASRPRTAGSINVPPGTQLTIKLLTPISTKTNRVGDTFRAAVVTPGAYQNATIEGHITTLEKSGRVSGRTEMSFAFNSITLADGRQGPLSADLERIIESETVRRVDEEGRVETGSRTKDSQVRGGVGAAAGAIIGGIAGGVKGAILGAIIGGAAGVGTVYVEGDKELIFDPGTEMVIRTVGSSAR